MNNLYRVPSGSRTRETNIPAPFVVFSLGRGWEGVGEGEAGRS